jgi:excisionase family DNA binding protein
VLTVSEAAVLAGRGEETIRRWVRSGRLPCRRDGPRLLIAREDVQALLAPTSLPLPAAWRRTAAGVPQPPWVSYLRRSREGVR